MIKFLLYFSQLEPCLFCLDLMDQRFHLAKNKPSKFIQLDINLASMRKLSQKVYVNIHSVLPSVLLHFWMKLFDKK